MILEDLLPKLESTTQIKLLGINAHSGESFCFYKGPADLTPYIWIDEKIEFDECISVEDGVLVITVDEPKLKRIDNTGNTVAEWMDKMDEEEVLKWAICFLYHYDVGTIRDEPANFSEDEWSRLFSPMIDFLNNRLGAIQSDAAIRGLYKSKKPGGI